MSDATAGEYLWEGERVARWLAQAHGLDRQLTPVSDLLFAAAALGSGERVLDVGCGHGPTTRRAASEVGPYGRITGLDVSSDMIAAAEEIEVSSQAATIDWVHADVTGWEAPYAHDSVISRFGVMFFADPVAAFSSLAAATVPGGRLCMAVWGRREASDLFEVPYQAAAATLDELGLRFEEPPADGGPYSLSDRDASTGLLEAAGWSDVGWSPHEVALPVGGGVSPEEAGAISLDFGPARLITPEAPSVRQQVVDAITDAYRGHLNSDGHVVLGGQVVVITARRA
ncbi:MAG: methyltransferase domain-containing protein [Actinobacteria bacterium]|nr:methyltransferase domain-containing protein [Actinomycetota bacterium]